MNCHYVAIVVAAVIALAACGEQPVDYPPRQPPAGLLGDPEQIAAGRQLFLDKCASCHGKPSEGRSPRAAFFEPPAPDFTEDRYLGADPAYLYWRIEGGKNLEPFRSQGSVMPAWGGLPEREIWQMVAYLQQRAQ